MHSGIGITHWLVLCSVFLATPAVAECEGPRRPNIIFILSMTWATPTSAAWAPRTSARRTSTAWPAKGVQLHRLLRQRPGLHADAGGVHHRPLAAARRPRMGHGLHRRAVSPRRRQVGRRAGQARPRPARQRDHRSPAAQGRRLSHRRLRQMAPRLPARVQPDPPRLRRVLRRPPRPRRLLPLQLLRRHLLPLRERASRSRPRAISPTCSTERAVEFIERHGKEPFFLYVPHLAVHFPVPAARPARPGADQGERRRRHAQGLRRDARTRRRGRRPDARRAREARRARQHAGHLLQRQRRLPALGQRPALPSQDDAVGRRHPRAVPDALAGAAAEGQGRSASRASPWT